MFFKKCLAAEPFFRIFAKLNAKPDCLKVPSEHNALRYNSQYYWKFDHLSGRFAPGFPFTLAVNSAVACS